MGCDWWDSALEIRLASFSIPIGFSDELVTTTEYSDAEEHRFNPYRGF